MALRAFPVIYACDVEVDGAVAALREAGTRMIREPADMFWGERLAYAADPEGNVVVLAGGNAS